MRKADLKRFVEALRECGYAEVRIEHENGCTRFYGARADERGRRNSFDEILG